MWQQSEKYKNKYRIPSARWQDWDYGANGCYYVTICTKNREHYFGEIVQTANVQYPVHLRTTPIGEIAQKYWQEIPQHFPFVTLDEFVIMPNHIHGILFFDKSVETHNCASLQWQPNIFGVQSQNLGSVIRGFKSSLKRYANNNDISFAWQTRFYDSIICDNEGLANVRAYIFNNPINWHNDELNENNNNNINQ